MRRALSRPQMQALDAKFSIFYVIGQLHSSCPPAAFATLGCSNSTSSPLACTRLREEQQKHGDLHFLAHARECGKRAVAEKAFEWYREASSSDAIKARWIGKLDDDTLPNLWRLARDVRQMETALTPVGLGYYGALGWRIWSHTHRHVCFRPLVNNFAGPTGRNRYGLSRLLRSVARARSATNGSVAHCSEHSHSGPYPYADGMLHLLSRDLARQVFNSELAFGFARGAWRLGTPHPTARRDWDHEDVGIGFLIFAVSLDLNLRTTYFSLQHQHVRVFGHYAGSANMEKPNVYEVRRRRSVPKFRPDLTCATTMAHNVRRARLLFDTAHTYHVHHQNASDVFTCGDCSEWAWHHASAPSRRDVRPDDAFTCCHKPSALLHTSADGPALAVC